MARYSSGVAKWRMVRRALTQNRFAFAGVRDMTRHDAKHCAWLIENELYADVGAARYEITERGRAAADLGFYDWQPRPRPR